MTNLDAFTTERVLDGEIELTELRDFFEALRTPSHASELALEHAIVPTMLENIKVPMPVLSKTRSGKAGRRFTRRVAVGAAAVVLSLGGVAAAATGVNPLSPIMGGSAQPSLEAAPETTQAPSTTRSAASSSTTAGSSSDTTEDSSSPSVSIECVEGNHGKTVSSVAQSNTPGKPATPGENHGSLVREAAKSDCGKDSTDTDTGASKEDESPATTAASTPTATSASTSLPSKSAPGNSGGKGNSGK